MKVHDLMETPETSVQDQSTFLQLPPEILYQILGHLECPPLISLSRTCRRLRSYAANDSLWACLVRGQLPADDFPQTPYPAESYQNLYMSHHPLWYLPHYKIWFSNQPHTGKIILVKFNPRSGCIEGYQLIADRSETLFQAWSHKPGVVIHTFSPRVLLWPGDPVLKLEQYHAASQARQGWWDGEIEMQSANTSQNVFSTYFLSRTIPESLLSKSIAVWPPWTIPRMPRARSVSQDKFSGWGHKPQRFAEISNTTFRLHKWIQFPVGASQVGIRMGEEISTWSTLVPELYMPTEKKPYQGIFVGDYAGHGCEFLLVMQTDHAPEGPPRDNESRYYHGLIEDDEALMVDLEAPDWREAKDEEGIYQGSIEAIKLTGDLNVPRGEHTFVADDIGPAGLIRIAKEEPFQGARVVKSRGHVAARGFREGRSTLTTFLG